MKLYFAPMEGITTFPFRQIHHEFFPGIDRYYTPFLTATQTETFKRKEIRDILPENNIGLQIVPQVLGNDAQYCLSAIRRIAAYGYDEVNFNLGCSMPQVANRGRGAGFLKDPEKLDAFFETLFTAMDAEGLSRRTGLSVKTRVGVESPDEAAALLRVFNRYPFRELTVHPRLKKDLYKGTPDLDVFQMFYEECVHPLCYNGDVFSTEMYRQITQRFPKLQAVMLGRGLITDPSLARQIRGGTPADAAELASYLEKLRSGYLQYMPSDREVIPHMKEIWFYMAWHFEEEPKELKKLRKAKGWETFAPAQEALLSQW